eukprot:454086-Hanusia_phi.AAC.3
MKNLPLLAVQLGIQRYAWCRLKEVRGWQLAGEEFAHHISRAKGTGAAYKCDYTLRTDSDFRLACYAYIPNATLTRSGGWKGEERRVSSGRRGSRMKLPVEILELRVRQTTAPEFATQVIQSRFSSRCKFASIANIRNELHDLRMGEKEKGKGKGPGRSAGGGGRGRKGSLHPGE